MLKNHLREILFQHLQLTPTKSQESLADQLVGMMTSPRNRQSMLVKGYAGTGKTSVISAFVQTLNDFRMRSVLMAPTGRAAKVLSAYSGEQAFTIHKKIYRQKSPTDAFGAFTLNFNKEKNYAIGK